MGDTENSHRRRGPPTAEERAYAMQFMPGAVKIKPPEGPQRQRFKPKFTNIPIPKDALLENQGQSPIDYLDQDEAAAVAVSNAMSNGRVPRYSDIPSFRAPIKPLERPAFVPARMHYSILDDAKWSPPEEAKPKPMDVSTAEIVEKPLKKNATREMLEIERQLREEEPDMVADAAMREFARQRRHFVAYDDNDMFAYTTKHLPLPPYNAQLPPFFDVVRDGTVLVTRTQLVVVAFDRKAAVSIPLDNTKLTADGWQMHALRGNAPPPGTPLCVFSDEWAVGLNETRCYALTVDGWAWRRSIVPDMEAISVDLADLVDDNTVYIRNSKASRHLLVYFQWDDLDQEDVQVLYEGLDLDLRRGRLNFPKPFRKKVMRTLPSEEPIHVIPGAGGVALSYKPDHTWIFLFDATAKSYLPHKRIDFVTPRAVVLPSHIYFLAEHPDAKGSSSLVAKMSRSKEPNERTGEDAYDVFSYTHPDDIIIAAPPASIAASGAMPESFSGTGQTAVIISDDWRTSVVVEFDRRNKLLKLHGQERTKRKPVTTHIMTPGT